MMYENKIKIVRNEKGVTQVEVAKHLHITQSALAKIERNERPPIDIVFSLSDFFHVPVTTLYSKK